MDKLNQIHQWYCDVYQENLYRLSARKYSTQELTALAREESAAYLTAMESDPLLPMELWPPDYLGQQVYKLHKQVVREIAQKL